MKACMGRRMLTRLLMPAGAAETAFPLLAARALRAFGDGYVAVLLPAYLLALGFDQLDVGFLTTATLAGSALAILVVGTVGYRWTARRLLLSAAFLMAVTGLGFASISSFWPLFVVAFVGTLNPGSSDISVFLPLEHAHLAQAARGNARITLFARYSLIGSLSAAVGASAAVIPSWFMAGWPGLSLIDSLRAMFVLYGLLGGAVWLLYRTLPAIGIQTAPLPQPLGPSRRIVFKLATLFSIDAFAGGLLGNSLLTLWLFERFGLSLAQAGTFFFCAGLLSAGSQLAAPIVARKIGLLNTMVFTHVPANVCLIFAAIAPNLETALALLFIRSALSQMDVPTRAAYVMAVVTPAERTAAASVTAVSRSLASIASPTLTGALLASGLLSTPLIACGALKIAYDLVLLISFRRLDVPLD
ncbi:MAG TPA: MFS transporter [Nitrosospira sp.]|nr:MFS transporter [Nitrosospira sp.]